MSNDALDRLFNNNKVQEKYSLEQQMESADENAAEENDDFLSGMSPQSMRALTERVTEVTLDESKEDAAMEVNEPEPIGNVVEPLPIQKSDSPKSVEPVSPPPVSPLTQHITSSAVKPVEEEKVVEDIKEQPIKEEPIKEEVEEEVVKSKRGRKKKADQPVADDENYESFNDLFNPVMDQLAKDLIDDLIWSKHKIGRFNDKQMKILFDYMYSKF